MVNRFQFHSEAEGRTIHCLVLEQPRRNGTRLPVVSAGGKVYRVPVGMLRNVPTGSPIGEDRAAELLVRGLHVLHSKRARDRARAQDTERVNALLGQLLAF